METFKKLGKFAVVFLVVLPLLAGAICLGLRVKLDAAGWASWVQAVGSITALVVAIFVMSRQNSHSAQLVAQADLLSLKRRAQTISIVMENAHDQVADIIHRIRSGTEKNDVGEVHASLASANHFMGDVHRTLTSIPLHDLGSADMADGILRITQVASVLVATSKIDVRQEGIAGLHILLGALLDKSNTGIRTFRKGVAGYVA